MCKHRVHYKKTRNYYYIFTVVQQYMSSSYAFLDEVWLKPQTIDNEQGSINETLASKPIPEKKKKNIEIKHGINFAFILAIGILVIIVIDAMVQHLKKK